MSDRPLSRRTIAAEIFSDTDDPLGALRWCLASLRRATGSDTLKGDPIETNFPADTFVDVWNIENQNFDPSNAGKFLEGIEPTASAEFSTWLLIERERIAGQVFAILRRDAMQALSSGDFDRAIMLAELSVRSSPLDESGHILLVKSLSMAGNPGAALEHVNATEQEFLRQLGEKPSLALRAAARKNIGDTLEGISPRAIVDSLIKAGVAAVAAGAVDAGLDCLRRASADAEKIADKTLFAKSLQELGTALVHSIRGFDDEGAILLRQAAELAIDIGDAKIAACSLRELGYTEALAGRRPTAASFLSEALQYSEGDGDALAGVYGIIGFNLIDWGKHDEGLLHFEQSLEYARKTGNRRREIWSLGIGGFGQLSAGYPDVARNWLQTCINLCDEIRWIAFSPWPRAVLAEAKLKLNEGHNSLLEGLEGSLALSCQLGDPCWEAANAKAIGLVHAAANDTTAAIKWLTQARERCGMVTDLYVGLMVEILADQVRVHSKAGQKTEANETARELLSLAARSQADAHLDFATSMVRMPNN